jgi:ATP-dependent DNA ligase
MPSTSFGLAASVWYQITIKQKALHRITIKSKAPHNPTRSARLSTRLRGIVSKRLGSTYRSGRSKHWLKV